MNESELESKTMNFPQGLVIALVLSGLLWLGIGRLVAWVIR